MNKEITQEEVNKIILSKWTKEALAEHWVNERIRYNELKEQLDYIRSGEYYNQLRFERDMLQDLVDKGKISKEDKEFIYYVHENTELLSRIDKAIKYMENEIIIRTIAYDKLYEILKGDSNE